MVNSEKPVRDFKGVWIDKDIWLDEEMTWMEKLLFTEIHSLESNGECYASNGYFASFFKLSKDRISRMVSSLNEKGFIEVKLQYKPGTKQIEKRVITTHGFFLKKAKVVIPEQPKEEVPKEQPKKTENKDKPEQTKETESIPYDEIVAYLNEKLNKKIPFKSKTKLTRKKIKERWNEGFVLEDFKKVIDTMIYCWEGTKMEEHLTPKTLFGDNFETYLVKEKKKWVDFNEQKKSQQTAPTPAYNKFEFLQ